MGGQLFLSIPACSFSWNLVLIVLTWSILSNFYLVLLFIIRILSHLKWGRYYWTLRWGSGWLRHCINLAENRNVWRKALTFFFHIHPVELRIYIVICSFLHDFSTVQFTELVRNFLLIKCNCRKNMTCIFLCIINHWCNCKLDWRLIFKE